MQNRFILISLLLLMSLGQVSVFARDTGGKRSMNTPTMRPKENKPSQTGSKRVQDSTTTRTDRALSKNGSERRVEKTKNLVNRIFRKK